jgi:hypothetical protein
LTLKLTVLTGGHELAVETAASSAQAIAGRIMLTAIAPSPTAAPKPTYHALHKRLSEKRKVTTVGQCVLNSIITGMSYPAPNEYLTYSLASQISKFWLVSRLSTVDNQCYVGYVYSTNSLVSLRTIYPVTMITNRLSPGESQCAKRRACLRHRRWQPSCQHRPCLRDNLAETILCARIIATKWPYV